MPRGQHHPHYHTIKRILETATEPLSAMQIAERVYGRIPTSPEWFSVGGMLDMLTGLKRLQSPDAILYARRELYEALDRAGRIGPEKPLPRASLWQLFSDYFEKSSS